jgi:hypothetical protein
VCGVEIHVLDLLRDSSLMLRPRSGRQKTPTQLKLLGRSNQRLYKDVFPWDAIVVGARFTYHAIGEQPLAPAARIRIRQQPGPVASCREIFTQLT